MYEEFEQVLVRAFLECIRRNDTRQIDEMLQSMGPNGGDEHKKILFMLNQIC